MKELGFEPWADAGTGRLLLILAERAFFHSPVTIEG